MQKAAKLVLLVASRSFGVQKESLLNGSRSTQDIAFARQAAMYLLHIVFGLTYKDVGTAFGRERTTVKYACERVEDERDVEAFDTRMDTLEARLVTLWTSGPDAALNEASAQAAA